MQQGVSVFPPVFEKLIEVPEHIIQTGTERLPRTLRNVAEWISASALVVAVA